MWLVRLALRRPYTFVALALLITILGGAAIVTMPADIFPNIDIPVVSVVWSFSGMTPEEMEKRIVTVAERAMTVAAQIRLPSRDRGDLWAGAVSEIRNEFGRCV